MFGKASNDKIIINWWCKTTFYPNGPFILLVVTGDHHGALVTVDRDILWQGFVYLTNHSHSVFRRKQNVQNILLKRVQDISKQHLLILYMIVRWRDKCDIFLISTKHSAEMVQVRKKKNDICDKPMVVVDHNRRKCAVDLSDQMIAYSTPHRRTLKWYIKLAKYINFKRDDTLQTSNKHKNQGIRF